MNDPIFLTIMIGSALLFCGYLLGKSSGYRSGFDDVMTELIKSKLVEPIAVLTHYANQGNERAQEALARLNAERKAEFQKKDSNDA